MDFSLIMFVMLLITGSVWLLDKFLLKPHRAAQDKEPWWVEYSRSFFPVILVVFLLRSFLVEPFKIPSSSMRPTLVVGDFIIVNKFTYGIRLPILGTKLIEINHPKRGDVMVFHFPEDPSTDFIKRVIGLPGDTVEYRHKELYINGVLQEQQRNGDYNYVESALNFVHTERYNENLTGHMYPILTKPEAPSVHLAAIAEFPQRENCEYFTGTVRCRVPSGHYFMLGDNRDNSRDSRYWGFVPDKLVVGKAFMIWMNFSDLKRIGLPIN